MRKSKRLKKRFKHYKEFITPEQVLYDEAVLSKLLSLTPKKKLMNKTFPTLIDSDTPEEDVDCIPSTNTSKGIDVDDFSETKKESISIQEDKISPSVSEKLKNSMPLID